MIEPTPALALRASAGASVFERTFIGDSYANQVGKGTHRALDRAQAFASRYRYML